MFFIAGTATKEKKLDFTQSIVCEICGSYGRYEVFMTYSYFSLFFIPIFKWNKKYYVLTSCCNTTYLLDKDIGQDIERAANITINESYLQAINIHRKKVCSNCKSHIEDSFEYCPKCGVKLK